MDEENIHYEKSRFDKWQMYTFIRRKNIGPCSVPKTDRLTAKNLQAYLDKFRRVYIKPIDTWGGTNISLVERDNSSMIWTAQGQQSKSSNVEEILHYYDGTAAIVQQAIPALQYHDCPFDIRVHMQRDVDENWVYAGELVRVGRQGIVSNVEISTGRVLPLLDVVSELIPLDDAKFTVLRKNLSKVGHGICKQLDAYPNVEEVGIDLALDASSRLWLIEINTNDASGGPSHELFRHLPDQRVYSEIRERANSRSVNTFQLLFDMLTESPSEELRQ